MRFILAISVWSIIISQSIAGENDLMIEREILNKLYEKCEQPTLTILQMRILLERLKNHYEGDPKKWISLKGTNYYLEIIELSERAPCFKEEIYAKVEKAENDHSSKGQCNMVEFIQFYKQLYTARCNEELEGAYMDSIAKIPKEIQTELFQLVKSVEALNKGQFNAVKPFYSDQALYQGIYNYLVEIMAGAKYTEKHERCGIKMKNLSKLYHSKVVSICDQIGIKFKENSKKFLDKVADKEKVLASFDSKIKPWLMGGSICLDIKDESDFVLDGTFDFASRNKPKNCRQCLFNYY